MLLAFPVGAATPIVDQADRPARAAAILTRTIYVTHSGSTEPITWFVYLPLLARAYRADLPPLIVTTTHFGFNFISSAEARAAEIRYQRAAEAGATVNRWPAGR